MPTPTRQPSNGKSKAKMPPPTQSAAAAAAASAAASPHPTVIPMPGAAAAALQPVAVTPAALGMAAAPKAAAEVGGGGPNVIRAPVIPLPDVLRASLDIDAKYAQLGGASGFLGQAVGNVAALPDGVGYDKLYQFGTIYWHPTIGAHEVHGAIRDKWNALGAEHGFLGYPVTDESGTPDGVGRYNHFQGGSIYWTPQTGAHEVHGAIRDEWSALGWERSFLGYPLTDETGAPDGVGRYNHFQGGSVYWSPASGAHEVHGAIRDKWASMGWEQSWLGYPTSDEMPTPDGGGRMNTFQRGTIVWTAQTGAAATPLTLHFHDVLTSGLPLGGWVDIVMNSTGDLTFAGHLHDSGFDNIDYTLSVVVVSPSGTAIGFQHQGHTEGTVAGLPFGTPNRDDDWTKPDHSQQIVDHWDELSQGHLFWRLDATDTLAQGALQILGDLAQQALKALGAAATAALVALIFA